MGATAPGAGQEPPASTSGSAGAGAGARRPPLTAEAVAALAAEAIGDGPGSAADTRLRAIREQRVLESLATTGEAPWAGELARDWATARRETLDLLAIHAGPDSRPGEEVDEVLDAMTVQLLTDPDARARLRRRLDDAVADREPPPWFAAALSPQARVGRLVAAAVLLPQVEADDPSVATTARIPRVETPPASAVARDPTQVVGSGATTAGMRPAPSAATVPGTPAADRSTTGAGGWSRIGGALVAPALALLVAAAGLRWPVVTAVAVVIWVVLDRVVSFLADPFLRLVGGWPPRIHGWAVVWLPLRLLGVLLRGPWRLLGGLLLLVLWGVAVDRALLWSHAPLGELVAQVAAMEPTAFAARWFVPVAAAGIVWQATRRRRSRPSLRGAAAVAGLLRSLPAGLGGLVLVPAAALFVVAANAPADQPWAPYADHRDAIASWVPTGGWWETGTAWVSGFADRVPGVSDVLEDLLPGDEAATPRWQVVDAAALNVRAGPGTGEPVLFTLPRDAVVEGTGETAEVDGTRWVQLRASEGRTGWASGDFLERREP